MGRRAIHRGNVIGPCMHARLQELRWENNELLARLHQMSAVPGYEELSGLTEEMVSKLRHGRRPAFDYETFAIAEALSVNPAWLAGRSPLKERPQDLLPLLTD